jgi:Ca2+-binding RTX toxin-like protein
MATFVVSTLADENDSGTLAAASGGTGLSLREAVRLANANPDADRIVFEPGLAGQTIRLTSGVLTLASAITIDGDLDGDGVADITISGDKTGNGASADDTRIFNIGSDATAVLDGLVLTGGYSKITTGTAGAVFSEGALTIRNSVVKDSVAIFTGGGSGAPVAGGVLGLGATVIENTTFSNNSGTSTSTSLYGRAASAVLQQGGSLSLADVEITGGVAFAEGALPFDAGAIYATYAAVSGFASISGVTSRLGAGAVETDKIVINGGTGSIGRELVVTTDLDTGLDGQYGGSLASDMTDGGGLSLREAVHWANTIGGTDRISFAASIAGKTITLAGGSLYLASNVTIDGDIDGDKRADITISGGQQHRIFIVEQGAVRLESLTLTDGFNDISGGAAVRVEAGSSLVLSYSTLTGHNAASPTGTGGAITSEGDLNIFGSTISGNTAAGEGGGISVSGGTALLTNTTISGNSATRGGGIDHSGGTLAIYSSTITQNTATTAGGGVDSSGSFTATNTVLAGNSAAGSFTGSLALGALADNGGPVKTHAILPGSVLIDAGDNAALSITVDANGDPRIVHGTVDIGATEFQLKVTTELDVVDANDGLLSLREAVTLANANANQSDITFAKGLAGKTITLTSGQLLLTSDISIDGDVTGNNKADITISGNNTGRIFDITVGSTDVDLHALNVVNGTSSYYGGAIRATDASSLDLVGVTISGSSAGRGGAVYAYATAMTISGSRLTGNTASVAGGAILSDGTLTVTNSTIDGNRAAHGGAIYGASGSNVTLTNTTVVGNSAGVYGGGINARGHLTLQGVTLTDNRTDSNNPFGNGAEGGAGLFIADPGTTVTINNSVVAGNFAGGVANDIARSSVDAGSNNVFGVLGTGVTVPNHPTNRVGITDLGLGELLDNGGGIVLTRAVLDGSTLIGAGTNTGVTQEFDANGQPRINGGTVDIGASEYVTHQKINGTSAANSITGGKGFDIINGKGGTDTAVYSGAWKDYLVTKSGSIYTVLDQRAGSPDGTDTVTNVEKLKFSNGEFAIAATLRDAPTATTMSAKAATENVAFTFNAAGHFSDADAALGDKLTFSLTGAPSWLTINAATGVLSGTPGFSDAAATKTVTVKATDLFGASVSKSFALTVADTNRAPVITSNGGGGEAEVSIKENTRAVTTVRVADPDAGATKSFSLSGADANKFAISSSGVLTFKTAPNFEVPTDDGKNNSYFVNVTVKDNGNLTDSQVLRVLVTNVNEQPTNVTLSKASVKENLKAGTVVGTLGVVDPDGPSATYKLTGNPGGFFKIAGNTLQTAKKLDFEKLKTHSITIEATDPGGLKTVKAFTIKVGDVIDVITGTARANKLNGAVGADDIRGLGGNDTLSGKGGNDILDGGDGNDLLIGGPGGDRHIGGKGSDTASYQDMTAALTASLANAKSNKGAAKGDTYGGVENLTGGAKGDVLTGNDGANVLKGLAGNDKLIGLKGADRLEGGLGKDTLTGGDGGDHFVFSTTKDSPATKKLWDVITDFSQAQKDRMDLSAIDAKTGKGNQSFTFIEDAAFSKTKGELRFEKVGKTTFVYGDVNGDGKADFAIALAGKIDLVEGDFVL